MHVTFNAAMRRRYDVELFQKIEALTGQKIEQYPTEQVPSAVDPESDPVCRDASSSSCILLHCEMFHAVCQTLLVYLPCLK